MKRSLCWGTAVIAAMVWASGALAGEKISLWHAFGNATEPSRINMAKWDATHPDTPLDPKFIPYSQLAQQFIKAIAVGEVPDIVTIDAVVVASFANQGALEDVTERVKASSIIKKDAYYPGAWAMTLWKGRQHAIPGEANTLALYYNADMFRAKGLDPDKPPRTWGELKAAAERLTDPEKNVYGIGFSAIQNEEGTFQFLPFLQQSGGSLKDLTSADSVEALKLWTDWVQKGQASKDVLVKRQFEMTNSFLGGACAMVIGGPWELQRMNKDAKFEWRTAKLPVREGKNIEASALGGFAWSIPKGAKNPDLAFKLIEFMSEPEQMKQSWSGGRLPPVMTVTIEESPNSKAFEVFRQQMEFARPRGPHPEWPQISVAIQTAYQSALTGRATPAEALAKAQATIKPLLDKQPVEGF